VRADRHKPLARRKGAALIAVMWVALIGGIVLLGAGREVRVHVAMAYNELGAVQAHWLARAGVEQAMAILEDDDAGTDSTEDLWYDDLLTLKDIELGGGQFSVLAPARSTERPRQPRYGLIDHAGRANLNLVDAGQLKKLADLSDMQVASLIDWRDGDDKILPGGAEQSHYEYLRYPYKIRNGPLTTIRELLLVRGMDLETFGGEDVNGNGVLDMAENDLKVSHPPDNGDGKLDVGLAGLTTVYSYERNVDSFGGQRLNLNGVTSKELTDQFSFTDALARAVEQKGKSNGFKKVMDLLEVKVSGRGRPRGPRGAVGPIIESGGDESSSGGSPGGADRGEEAGEGGEEGKVNKITLDWLADHLDELTVSDEPRLPGRINVNTAAREVLLTLPRMTEEIAESIINRRESADGAIESVGDLFRNGMVKEDVFKALAESATVRSNVFEIRSSAVTSSGVRKTIVAVVDRGSEPMTVLYWYQGE